MHNCVPHSVSNTAVGSQHTGARAHAHTHTHTHVRTGPSVHTDTSTCMYACMHIQPQTPFTPTRTHIHALTPVCKPHTQLAHTLLQITASASSSG